jgi:hypothetical protein
MDSSPGKIELIMLIVEKMTRIFFFILAVVAVLLNPVVVAAQELACSTSPEVVGPCFFVHARLSVANGNPDIRLWPVGSKRILGVWPINGNPEEAPGKLQKLLNPDPDVDIFGDYQVCPLTAAKPGWMQMVCISHAANLNIVERNRIKVRNRATFSGGIPR